MSGTGYSIDNKKRFDFLIGFAGWFVINSLAWLATGGAEGLFYSYGIQNLLFLPLNILALLLTIWRRRWVGWGILVAIALNLFISLLIGAWANATCAIPFWVPE
jgi:hypothetical protein